MTKFDAEKEFFNLPTDDTRMDALGDFLYNRLAKEDPQKFYEFVFVGLPIHPEFKARFLALRDAKTVIEETYKVSSARRPDLIVDWAYTLKLDEGDGPLFWEVIQEVWCLFDLVPHGEFEVLFENFMGCIPRPDLPEKFTAYRGQKDGDEPDGLSWTLSREVAEKFSKGTRGETAPNPVVFEEEIAIWDVAFYCNDRKEEEVVLYHVP